MNRRVSFVIASRDEEPEILHRTIEGIVRTTPSSWREIVVVDDGSQTPIDYSHPEVTVVRNSVSVGVCPSRRRGCAIASGDIFSILDPHMTFGQGWLEEMLQYADSGALLCSPWRDYDLKTVFSYGANFGWKEYPSRLDFSPRRNPPRARCSRVPMVIGASYMLSRQSYEHLGGFNPHYKTWGFDEQDLSLRAWLSGLEVRCVNRAVVGHLTKTGGQSSWTLPAGLFEFNSLVLMQSIFEKSTLELFAPFFEPRLPAVQAWMEGLDFESWRSRVQSVRTISDQQLFRMFPQGWPVTPQRPRISSKYYPAGWARQELPPRTPPALRFEVISRHLCAGMTFEVEWPESARAEFQRLMPGAETLAEPEHRFRITDGFAVTLDGQRVTAAADLGSALAAFRKALLDLLSQTSSQIFFTASVFESGGKLLVLPRRPHDGHQALVAELIRQGARLISDRYLVLDAKGWMVPFGCEGEAREARADLMVSTRILPGSRCNLRRLPAALVLKPFLETRFIPQAKWPAAVRWMAKFSAQTQFLRSPRDCPRQAAEAILKRLRAC